MFQSKTEASGGACFSTFGVVRLVHVSSTSIFDGQLQPFCSFVVFRMFQVSSNTIFDRQHERF